jgi:hypothetical protein
VVEYAIVARSEKRILDETVLGLSFKLTSLGQDGSQGLFFLLE